MFPLCSYITQVLNEAFQISNSLSLPLFTPLGPENTTTVGLKLQIVSHTLRFDLDGESLRF